MTNLYLSLVYKIKQNFNFTKTHTLNSTRAGQWHIFGSTQSTMQAVALGQGSQTHFT